LRHEIFLLKIYCTTHKPLCLAHTGITTLQVGGATEQFADLSDRTGVSISDLNDRFSELTGHYAIWQNHPSEVVGFCHHRRFLLPDLVDDWLQQRASMPYANRQGRGVENYASGYQIDRDLLVQKLTECNYIEALESELSGHDILLPKSNHIVAGSFLKQYGRAHPLHPLLRLLANLCERDDHQGKQALEFFSNHDTAYWNNLYVMRWESFIAFCEWQFELLFQLNDQIAPLDDPYQNRICAFLSERLLNFWIWHRQLRVRELNWCMTEAIESSNEGHQRGGAASASGS
jgi:hypothetical protein